MRVLSSFAVALTLAVVATTTAGTARSDSHAADDAVADRPAVTVYKSPYCGCCGG